MRPAVWAPRAERVDVVLGDGTEHRLEAGPDGWHRGDDALDLPHGTRYAFRLDGGDPLPDPRSHHQPDGIDTPSAVVDHRCFEWTDAEWRGFHFPGAVLYELHIGTFTPAGTFDAVALRIMMRLDDEEFWRTATEANYLFWYAPAVGNTVLEEKEAQYYDKGDPMSRATYRSQHGILDLVAFRKG